MPRVIVQLQPEDGSAAPVRLYPDPDQAEGLIQEGRSYVVIARGDRATERADLYLDGERLTPLRGESPGEAKWAWTPGFYAGRLDFELRIPGERAVAAEVTTDPDKEKLTRAEYLRMIEEILEDSLELLSLAGFRIGLGRGSAGLLPPIARLEWFRSRADEIEAAVRSIDRQPARFLTSEPQPVRASEANRVAATDLLRSYRLGTLRELPPDHRLRKRHPALRCLPGVIQKRERVAGTDLPEHRQIKGTLEGWAAWLTAVGDGLTAESDQGGRRGAKATVWARRCRSLARRFRALAELETFAGLPPAPRGIKLTSRFRRTVRYRRFYRLSQALHEAASNVFGNHLDVPVSETYRLYEFWTFLRIVRVLAERFGLGYDGVDRLFALDEGSGSLWFRSGSLSVTLADGSVVSYQESFRPYWESLSGLGTYSHRMQPDITIRLARTHSGKACRPLTLLDAKYRIGSGLSAAATSAHAYRDAIVCVPAEKSPSSAVSAVYLLSPHAPGKARGDWRSTPMPKRLFHEAYRRKFRFGAVEMRPGMDTAEIRRRLGEILPGYALSDVDGPGGTDRGLAG